MKRTLKRILALLAPLVDCLLVPLTFLSALLLFLIRTAMRRFHMRMPWSERVFRAVGVYPVIDHYYEPLFHPRHLRRPLDAVRRLPGLDLNVDEQLEILDRFHFNDELLKLPIEKRGDLEFFYHNPSFGPGDAEYLYGIIRSFRPRRLIEIGSGHSTLMALCAVAESRREDPGYSCQITCVEPYEVESLEKTGVNVVRERVETLDTGLFAALEPGDILFIDSSHVIRPQGDVLFEYMEILPILAPGVLVHIHDIFTPRDYPENWVLRSTRFWNEQYLLEAFLALNKQYKVIGALNYLKHDHFARLAAGCPILAQEPHAEPGSFWIMRT